jgi:N-acetyl-anhydromuramyl-L-alanine amidase AmpD
MTFDSEARAYLDSIAFRQARYPGPEDRQRSKPVRFIVIHSTEGSERLDSAEIALQMWHVWDRKSSVHYAVDVNSTVCAMKPEDKAWHAGGGNSDTVGIEHCGTARQTRNEWLDTYGIGMMRQSAKLCAALCSVFEIPVRRATALDHARANDYQPGEPWQRGILAHNDITESAKLRGLSTDGHWDPGPAFPWDYLLELIALELEDYMPLTDVDVNKIVAALRPVIRKEVNDEFEERIGKVAAKEGTAKTVFEAARQAIRDTPPKAG